LNEDPDFVSFEHGMRVCFTMAGLFARGRGYIGATGQPYPVIKRWKNLMPPKKIDPTLVVGLTLPGHAST
jgi:hypothetical protein